MSPAAGIRLQEVLKRDSIRAGAPPLPGVDAEPRQAQRLAEARRARVSEAPAGALAEGQHESPRVAMANLFFVCFLAVGLGVAAAAMRSVI